MATQEGKAAAEKKKSRLIPVTKDGETIHVHPKQVEQHQRLGWKLEEEK